MISEHTFYRKGDRTLSTPNCAKRQTAAPVVEYKGGAPDGIRERIGKATDHYVTPLGFG